MSKTSPKQRLIQLQEWLASRNGTTNKGGRKPISKADAYKNTRKRYGKAKNN